MASHRLKVEYAAGKSDAWAAARAKLKLPAANSSRSCLPDISKLAATVQSDHGACNKSFVGRLADGGHQASSNQRIQPAFALLHAGQCCLESRPDVKLNSVRIRRWQRARQSTPSQSDCF